jgi:hypothetical protein
MMFVCRFRFQSSLHCICHCPSLAIRSGLSYSTLGPLQRLSVCSCTIVIMASSFTRQINLYIFMLVKRITKKNTYPPSPGMNPLHRDVASSWWCRLMFVMVDHYKYMLVKTKNIHRPRQRVVLAHCPSSVLPLGCDDSDAAYSMVVASFVVCGGEQAGYILH